MIDPSTYVGPYTSIGDCCPIALAEVNDSIVIDVERKFVWSVVGKGTKTMRTMCVIKIVNSCVPPMIAMFVAAGLVMRFEM